MKTLRILMLGTMLACVAVVAHATGVLNVLLGAGPSAPPYSGATYSGNVTMPGGCPSSGYFGYSKTALCGSISPTTDSNGNVIQVIAQDGGTSQCILQIISATNPGQSYFGHFCIQTISGNSCSVPSNGGISPSTATYSYSGGAAQWVWSATTCATGAVTQNVSYGQ